MNIFKFNRHIAPIFLALTMTFAAMPALASNAPNISREQAIAIVKQHYQGKTLKVSSKPDAYVVRLLTKAGKVKQLRVDKKTGELR